jgi:hypothetical protein
MDIDRKSSTLNSIHAGSTLDKPNVDLIINAVATILHSQMLEVASIFLLIIGPRARKDHSPRLRPVFLLRGEVYLGEARGFRQLENCLAERNT